MTTDNPNNKRVIDTSVNLDFRVEDEQAPEPKADVTEGKNDQKPWRIEPRLYKKYELK